MLQHQMCLSCLGGWWVPQLQGRRRRKLPGLLLLLHQSHAAVACDAAPLSAHGTMDSSPVLAHTRNKTMCAHMSAPIPHKLRVVLGSVDLTVRDDVQVQTDRQTQKKRDRDREFEEYYTTIRTPAGRSRQTTQRLSSESILEGGRGVGEP